MASRLDRLVLLLDTGSTAAVRQTAAQQLGEIQKQHPEELYNLLSRVVVHLRSKSWETRIAAGQAVEYIAANVEGWNPNAVEEGIKMEEQKETLGGVSSENASHNSNQNKLSFFTFDANTLLANGKTLLGSAGKEYEIDYGDMTPAERLAFQRKNLNATLGFGTQFMELDLLDDNDMSMVNHTLPEAPPPPIQAPPSSAHAPQPSQPPPPPPQTFQPPQPPQSLQPQEDESSKSARMRNMMKRKLKKDAKDKGKEKVRVLDLTATRKRSSDGAVPATPVDGSFTPATPMKVEPGSAGHSDYFTFQPKSAKVVIESKPAPPSPQLGEDGEDTPRTIWPFELICEHLCLDLFDPNWEIRHGAGIGLRSLLKLHGGGAGRVAGKTQAENDALNKEWLDDAAIRLLCVFALDRFGDFIGDSVVAPVRETCSQTLGVVLQWMNIKGVRNVVEALLQLIYQSQSQGRSIWEVRHAGMLGLKYAVAVRKDLISSVKDEFSGEESLLAGITKAVILGLQDLDDDVRGTSASTLLPIVKEFVSSSPKLRIVELVTTLWDCLVDLKDDLSASTGSVMELLGSLFSESQVMTLMREESVREESRSLREMIPRLYPFFRHTIASVRSAVLNTLLTFLECDTGEEWVDERVWRLTFQNLIVEERASILQKSAKVWERLAYLNIYIVVRDTQPWLGFWFEVTTTSIGQPLETGGFYRPPGVFGNIPNTAVATVNTAKGKQANEDAAAAGHNIDVAMIMQDLPLVTRDVVVRGRVAAATALGIVMAVWPDEAGQVQITFQEVIVGLLNCPWATKKQLGAIIVEEWARASRVRKDGSAMEIDGKEILAKTHPFAKLLSDVLIAMLELDPGVFHAEIISDFKNDEAGKIQAETNVYAAVAGAVVELGVLPAKVNPVVRSVMNSIKYEANAELQQRAAATLASFVKICALGGSGKINPNDKIVKNLCAFLCSDVSIAPVLEDNKVSEGILSVMLAKEDSVHAHGRKAAAIEEKPIDEPVQLVRRGAETALREFCTRFEDTLFDVLPKLWECVSAKVTEVFANDSGGNNGVGNANKTVANSTSLGQEVVDCLTVLNTIVPFLSLGLHSKIIDLLPIIAKSLQSQFAIIRSVASRTLATICNVITIEGMSAIIERVLPLLGDTTNVIHRQGATEMIYHLVQIMDSKILPYVIFLIVPVLGRMSDGNDAVRMVMTNCFAQLIKLVPLEAGIPDPPGMRTELLAHRKEERKFLAQLMDSSKLEPYEIPVHIKAELRKYQQEGVNWLGFLNKYQLHGILCDDMGLGKTLQSICILASDRYYRAQKFAETKSPACAPLPSLVVCPPTLTGHWYHEILNYTDTLKPLLYTGGPSDRKALRASIKSYDVAIMSYDIVRNDIEDLSKIDWNYCILDEGHVIKNGKTKLTQAVKRVRANHRLILSGTPIQNNVLELWSLFDFLMPGFLGTEKIFNERFGRPILASKDAKSSSKEQEAGALALEALHKQVLPFLLRRLKEDVLHDLPPKIIQDYYCELSDLQKQLYEEFARSQSNAVDHDLGDDDVAHEGGQKKATHIFQALQYLRKLCNHPLLVLNENHPEYQKVSQHLAKTKTTLHDLENAPKLKALEQLLIDCGIGTNTQGADDDPANITVSQHRVLIFCQLKTMLDIIEKDLFQKFMPSVTYLRMDGSTDANKRHDIVQKFNKDPSFDVLLLTTHVGGLGLNLTGADTVIFVEHDWNPMKDLQAMDRAHRIGQKKVVNVYRLITKGTLEEKIMGLQKFKLNIANSVVNQQNSGLQSMDTDQILDLFNVSSGSEKPKKKVDDSTKTTAKAVLENLETLWDDKQYNEEYNLDSFISSLK